MLILEEHALFSYKGSTRGTGHGTPWEHDTVVPLLMRGPRITPRKGERVDARAIAPTIASLIEVDPPQDAQGSTIEGAIARCTLGEMVQAMADVYGRYSGGPEW